MSSDDTIENLRTLIEEAISQKVRKGDHHFSGADWWQVTEDETKVFELEPTDMPRLSTVYDAYEHVLDLAGGSLPLDDTACENIRKAMSWLRTGILDDGDFIKFAQIFDVRPKKAHAMYWKMMFWQIRRRYIDILPPQPTT